jgi:hypothetical protein
MLTLVVKSQWVRYKLDETIEQPCSDFLAHTCKCVRVLISTTSIWLSKDNHDSWGTCTTSVECKTIIIAMLIVMSDMDPHMISGNLGWVLLSLGLVVSKWVLLGCGVTPQNSKFWNVTKIH